VHRRARRRHPQARGARREHGDAVDLMRTIKRALDPHDILNPGKTVPL
jgi:D-lactate dehydrogenase (cytochrome)